MNSDCDRVLLNIALNLSSNLASDKQYQCLIDGMNQVFPCDASALLMLDEDGFLTPIAVKGLAPTVLGQRFYPPSHPRLNAIMQAREPVRFDFNCALPDPFDGMLENQEHPIDVHDCLGCSLYVEGQLVGVLTMDSLEVGAFDTIDYVAIKTFAALAAATLRNIGQLNALKAQNKKQKSVTDTLIQQARSLKGDMVGISPPMEQLRLNMNTVANSDYAVLITGETGTGKELVAHGIHAQSRRSDKPMIYVNCAALPEGIAESELFGHVKGAFTGANSHRAGKFELADGGTLFLDEVGELPLTIQAKLLRVIQQGELQRIGSDNYHVVDVRIIAATNRHLEQEVKLGNFRADLYHRLNVFPILVPPLRDRKGDIPVLCGYLLEKVRHQFNQPNLQVHPKVLPLLAHYPWRGNVRELEHVLTRAALRAIQDHSKTLTVNHFDLSPDCIEIRKTESRLPETSTNMRVLIEQYQRELIRHALEQTDGVWLKAAEFLQMDRGNLYRMGKKLGMH